jgi:hypothetical protein
MLSETRIPFQWQHGSTGTIIAQHAALSLLRKNCDASEARSYPPSRRSKKGWCAAAMIELRRLGVTVASDSGRGARSDSQRAGRGARRSVNCARPSL